MALTEYFDPIFSENNQSSTDEDNETTLFLLNDIPTPMKSKEETRDFDDQPVL